MCALSNLRRDPLIRIYSVPTLNIGMHNTICGCKGGGGQGVDGKKSGSFPEVLDWDTSFVKRGIT